MKFVPTDISDVITIEPDVFDDGRGFFMELYHGVKFSDAGIQTVFVQENLSGSRRGTLRGLHYQIQKPQGKLISAIKGEIFDVALDIRRNSPTFGKWVGAILSETNRKQIWIPPGFAHGFYVRSEWAEVRYLASDFYAPDCERTIQWNDPDVGISWPFTDDEQLLISEKDELGQPFSQAEVYE
ncbi:dTDP-4-dehydrorhamnose 3,5-epimerase [Candidatus Latescibacterota bacterium]